MSNIICIFTLSMQLGRDLKRIKMNNAQLMKPIYEFTLSSQQTINIRLEYNGNGWGTGVNSLLKRNSEYPGKMAARIVVSKRAGGVNTPIGFIETWEQDKDFKTITKCFKTYEDFIKISQEVGNKKLEYFK